MKTISSIVEEYIKTKPFLSSALSQGIINLTSLSRQIKPEIEHQLGKEVKNGAIVMALKRLSSELEFRVTHRVLKFVRNIGEITVRSALNDYTFKVSELVSKYRSPEFNELVGADDAILYTSAKLLIEAKLVTAVVTFAEFDANVFNPLIAASVFMSDTV